MSKKDSGPLPLSSQPRKPHHHVCTIGPSVSMWPMTAGFPSLLPFLPTQDHQKQPNLFPKQITLQGPTASWPPCCFPMPAAPQQSTPEACPFAEFSHSADGLWVSAKSS